MRVIESVACAAVLSWASMAAAQTAPVDKGVPAGAGLLAPEPIDAAQARLAATPRAVGPATTSSPVSSANALELNAAQDSSSVSVTASVPLHSELIQALKVTASAPIDQSGGSTDIASLDGLAKGFSVKLQASGSFRARRGSVPYTVLDQKIRSFCASFWAAYDKEQHTQTDPTKDCHIGDIGKLNDPNPWYDQFEDLFFEGPSWTYGLTAGGGAKQFKFFDPNSLASQEANKAQWSAGGFAAVQPSLNGTLLPMLLTASYQHQRAYDDADTKMLCPASSGDSAPVACVNGPIGVPVLTTKDLAALEFRWKPASNFAFAVTGTYDAKAKVWGVEAPVYLVSDGKNGLAGGVKVGWRSDTRAVTAGVFVSKPFDLIPGV